MTTTTTGMSVVVVIALMVITGFSGMVRALPFGIMSFFRRGMALLNHFNAAGAIPE